MSRQLFANHLSSLTRGCRTRLSRPDLLTPISRTLSSKSGLGQTNRTALNLHGLCGPTLHHGKFLSSLSSSVNTMADLNKFFETVDSLKPEFIKREYQKCVWAAKSPHWVELSGVMWVDRINNRELDTQTRRWWQTTIAVLFAVQFAVRIPSLQKPRP